MFKKILMISLYLMIGYQAKASYNTMANSAEHQPASIKEAAAKTKNICTINAGDIGKLKYRGATYEEAFSRVTNECFQRRTDLFVKNRNQQPDQDRQILFAESCVNSVKCI